jgi:hypothetical protein
LKLTKAELAANGELEHLLQICVQYQSFRP